MTTVKSKTDRVTFISQKSDWLGLGPIKEVKMNKTLDVVQFYFEDGSIGEVHACNSGGLVLSPIVNVDSGLKALDVPRLDRASENPSEVTGSDGPCNPVGYDVQIDPCVGESFEGHAVNVVGGNLRKITEVDRSLS